MPTLIQEISQVVAFIQYDFAFLNKEHLIFRIINSSKLTLFLLERIPKDFYGYFISKMRN